MDDRGTIYTPDEVAALDEERRAQLVPIDAHWLDKVATMSRKERRAWYAERRREARKATRAAFRERQP